MNNAFFITVSDADQIEQTCEEIKQLDFVNDAVYGGASVSQLINILNLVRQGGFIFVILLFLLTAYLISSTIRTTIYARSKEIAIMRNVGASNHFNQGAVHDRGCADRAHRIDHSVCAHLFLATAGCMKPSAAGCSPICLPCSPSFHLRFMSLRSSWLAASSSVCSAVFCRPRVICAGKR